MASGRTGWNSASGPSASERRLAWSGVALVVAACAMLSGCGGLLSFSRVTVNEPLAPDDVAFITPGVTTFAKVVGRLGPPDELNPLERGVVASYYFLDAKYSRLNFGKIGNLWLPVSPDLVMAGGGLGTDMFQVQFDRNWVAVASSFAYHTGTPRFSPWPF